MDKKSFDFGGWATKYNIPCSDGRTIMDGAFSDADGTTVPLVWNHDHKSADNVLGHALLRKKDGGMYAYCTFNNTEQGKNAKELVQNGDISSLSIYANKLKQTGGNVTHGVIREVSLVLAGANPGACIDNVLRHSADTGLPETVEDEATIYNNQNEIEMAHSEEEKEEKPMEETKEKTVQDVIDSMTEEQKNVLYALVGAAVEEAEKKENTSEEENMKHNAFDTENIENNENVLTHSEFVEIVNDAKQTGSMKDAFLKHGITDVSNLFPEVRAVSDQPKVVDVDASWVASVIGKVHHTPFSRVKSNVVDITGEEARARGYIKGKQKKEEVMTALKRTTTPTTVYKFQKMDRDDILDITDFDSLAFIKTEMHAKLKQELARAFLFGDGRSSENDDKINELNIRPIATDNELYTIKKSMSAVPEAGALIDNVTEAMGEYEGAGNPDAYVRKDLYYKMLLLKDANGHRLYKDANEVAAAMTVNKLIPVPAAIMGKCFALVVDLADYNVGADKGGAVNFFDNFDLNFNKQEYLIETRCSGALVTPHSAISFVEAGE